MLWLSLVACGGMVKWTVLFIAFNIPLFTPPYEIKLTVFLISFWPHVFFLKKKVHSVSTPPNTTAVDTKK